MGTQAADFRIKLAESSSEMEAALEVRRRVFVEEQGVPPEEEYDEYDEAAVHAVALEGGKVIGTGRLFRHASGEARVGRMAVEAGWRRRGVGAALLAVLEQEARRRGFDQVVLHAQTYVQRFYAAHGYSPRGDVFIEAGIEHIAMRKNL